MGRKAIDYLKKIFGSGVVLKKVEKEQDGLVLWECACDCGKIITKTSTQLSKIRGIKCEDCSASKISKVKIGDKYSQWEVLGFNDLSEKHRKVRCRCDCGVEKDVDVNSLLAGLSQSCGCLASKLRTFHGLSGTPEWICYHGIKARCYNTESEYFNHYGGRGVIMCDRWLEPNGMGFINFLEDMGKRPSPKHSIDRKDVNGNYCPENCRWETQSMQVVNRRKLSVNTSGRTGVYWYENRQRWVVKMTKDGREHWGGQTTVYEDAVKMAEKLELELFGFSRKDYQDEA